ncbi:MAG TPA: molybdopterin molybdotransferase MoeA [Candidatus Omnitrophota bacterium]|nr:molybdopterin molybdotransferase MoeA [Candidatus Omnitrophota bacterium]HPD85588.1 molybdopterin molybdotransferase MoeA [Candidatus Omnitrophota bacterium]HRZ04372.1 molybdopterin molybdotransferase MoeA [Candidatus Omnitrophota bacterium]
MISINLAKQIIFQKTRLIKGVEREGFLQAQGRVLAQDIRTTTDLPAFNRATVDGFAVKSVDLKAQSAKFPKLLKIIGVAEAGCPSKKIIGKGQAIKIMTGGVVPKGADCVAMKEYCRQKGNEVFVGQAVRKGEGIAFKGEDAHKNSLIIEKGNLVTPAIVGLCATLGLPFVKVFGRPKTAILVTGNELLNVTQKLSSGKIRSSNQYSLFTQVKESGGAPILLGIARDDRRALITKIKSGFECDILLISGGVSVGDCDLVPSVLRTLGAKIFFHKVAVQPGKPLLFAKKNKTLIFGLPGNPVSTMVSFHEFVRPCILKMSGRRDFLTKTATAILAEEIKLNPARTKILRGKTLLREGELFVKLSEHQGSGNIISVVKADCLFKVPEGVRKVVKGRKVVVEYLS